MDEQSLRAALADLPIGRLDYYQETDSTNERALVALGKEREMVDYHPLVAERQTAGRGRMGCNWVITPGAPPAFTLVMQPNQVEQTRLGLFSLLGALSICRALDTLCGPAAQVKWPNDVLLGGKKTAGVLAESRWEGSRLRGVALGMGINVLPESIPRGMELLFPATCVQDNCPAPAQPVPMLKAVLTELISMRRLLPQEEFLSEYGRYLAFRGEVVQLSLPDHEIREGTLVGVDAAGQLILEDPHGKPVRFPIGDLRLRPKSD